MVDIRPANDGQDVIDVRGELDYHSSERLRDEITKFFKRGGGNLRLRLEGVEFIDSTGLSVLLDAVKVARAASETVTLVQPSPQLVRILAVSGFGSFFEYDYDGEEPAPQPEPVEHVVDEGLTSETFEAEGRPENIGLLRRGVARFAQHLPFTRQELDDIKLAVGEATTNALRYGCKTGRESIHITCTRRGRRFSVEVRDPGDGFDPDRVPDQSSGHLAEGGRGIFFMRCLMDQVNFRFGNGTTVELVKFIREHPEDEAPS